MRFFYFPTFRTETTDAPPSRLRSRIGCFVLLLVPVLPCLVAGGVLLFRWHPWERQKGWAELGIGYTERFWRPGPSFGVVDVLGRVTLRHRLHQPARRFPLHVVAFCDFPIENQFSYDSTLGETNILIVRVYPRAPNEHVEDNMPLSRRGGDLRLRLPSRRHTAKPITIKTSGCQQFWVERDGSITVIRHPLTRSELKAFAEELGKTGNPLYPTLQALENRPKATPSQAGETQASPR